MLDVATLVGGLIVAKDMKPVADIYMEEFQISKELAKRKMPAWSFSWIG